MRLNKLFVLVLCLLSGLHLSPVLALAPAAKLAFLVGVGEFASRELPPLEGPAEDVAALRSTLLTSWGYAPQNISTLVGAQASKKAILAGLKGLMLKSRAGDEIFIYFSGHGTSALDPNLGLAVPDGSGAFASYDANPYGSNPLDTLVVGSVDLRPIFEMLDQGGRKLWVVSDSCYSATVVRSIASGQGALRSRSIPRLVKGEMDQYLKMRVQATALQTGSKPFPYRNVAFLAAAAEGETAKDIARESLAIYPTVDGRPHGTLTDALLRVLQGKLAADFDGDGKVSLNEVHQAVGQFMAQRGYGHTPQRLPSVLEDESGVGNRPLLMGGEMAKPQFVSEAPKLRVDATALSSALRGSLQQLPLLEWSEQKPDYRIAISRGHLQLWGAAGDLVSEFDQADRGALLGQLQQLVWTQRLDLVARKNRRAALTAEISPSYMGGNFLVGDILQFSVRPDREAKILIVNADSLGKVSVLYPFRSNELATVSAGRVLSVGSGPHDPVTVTEPLGMDVQMLFAFDQPGPDLLSWSGVNDLSAESPRLTELEALLQAHKGRFSYVRTELRVLPRPARP